MIADFCLATFAAWESVVAFGLGAVTLAMFVGLSLAWASGRHEQAEDAAAADRETLQ